MISVAELGTAIAAARRQTQLTQLELASKAGVSRSTLDLLENCRAHEIGYFKLSRILTAVGLELKLQPMAADRPTLDDLLKESGDD